MEVWKFGALLHKKWEADKSGTTTIIGYWAEDNGKYFIDVPTQLRSCIIEMQNALSDKYAELEDAKRRVQELENQLRKVLE